MTAEREALLTLACSAAAGAVALLALLPVLDVTAEWIDDDFVNYRDNSIFSSPLSLDSVVRAIATPAIIGVYEPGALLAKQLVVAALGLYPVAIKLASLALHASNAALSAAFANGLLEARSGGPAARLEAFLAVALAAAHPLRAEVVAWCSCFPYGLATTACLLAALLHLHALRAGAEEERRRARLERASAACVACAVFCKASALGIGPFLLCLDAHIWACRPELLPRARLRAHAGWHAWRTLIVAVGAAFAAGADALQPLPSQPSPAQRALRATYGLWFNIRLNLWPADANTFYPPPAAGMRWSDPSLVGPAMLMGLATLLPPVLLCCWGLHRLPDSRWRRRVLAAWAWWLAYVVLLAPNLGVAGQHLTGSLAHNRFTYAPAFLAFAPAVQELLVLCRRRCGRAAVCAAGAALLVPLLLHTWEYAAAWNHKDLIGPRAVLVNPELKLHLANKAVLRAVFFEESSGRQAAAEEVLRRVLQHQPEHPGATRNLGRLLAVTGRAEEARGVLEGYVRRAPDAKAEWWLGWALSTLGARGEAEVHFQNARSLEPTHDAARDRDLMAHEAAEAAFRWN